MVTGQGKAFAAGADIKEKGIFSEKWTVVMMVL